MLINTRMTGRPSLAEQAEKRRKNVAQVYDGPVQEDHAAEEGFDVAPADTTADAPDAHRTKSRSPIADAIDRHNADAPTSSRAGRELLGGPTSPDRAPVAPTGGTAAPGAPSLGDARRAGSVTPDTLSTAAEAARDGATRAQTRAPAGLDFTSSGAGVHAASRHPDGSFLAAGDVPCQKLDLQQQGAHDVGPVFSRPNEALPGHAMNGPSTAQPNTATDERHGGR